MKTARGHHQLWNMLYIVIGVKFQTMGLTFTLKYGLIAMLFGSPSCQPFLNRFTDLNELFIHS